MATISSEFRSTPQLIFGPGAVKDLPNAVRSLGAIRALVVTDPGLVQAGLTSSVLKSFDSITQLSYVLFSNVKSGSPERVVYAAAQCGRDAKADIVIGLGGGSVLDTAKLVAHLIGCSGNLESIDGTDFTTERRLPLILIPTTAGTGSEVTLIATVTNDSQEKKWVVSPKLFPDIAILDAELTISVPWHVTAASGIDAIVRAIESYTSRHKRNVLSSTLAKKALELLAFNFPKVLSTPQDLSARSEMLLGSTLAGMAFANVFGGAVHALARPLESRHLVSHGLANALMLIPVLQFNAGAVSPEFGELAAVIGAKQKTADGFIEEMKSILVQSNLPVRLRDVGVSESNLDILAQDAMKQSLLLADNPVDVKFDDARRLYEQAY